METRLILNPASSSIFGNKCINQPFTKRDVRGD